MEDLLLEAFSDNGDLRQCKLVQIRPVGSGYRYVQWFTGRLCTLAPKIDTSTGVQIGMVCFCLSKACQLGYRPFIDFVYTPYELASKIDELQKMNVFSPDKLTNKMWSADKCSVTEFLSFSGIKKEDSVVSMLTKAVTAVQNWIKRNGVSKQQLAESDIPKIELEEYIQGNLYLTPLVLSKFASSTHPYVESLVKDFTGSMQQVTILEALINTLKSNGRQLTVVPSSRQDREDKLTVIPYALAKFNQSDVINPQHIISYSLGAQPLQRIREPNKIFVSAAYAAGWGAQDSVGMKGADKLAAVKGHYELPGTKKISRIKMLYTPQWLFDIMLEGTYDNKEISPLVHSSQYQKKKDPKDSTQGESFQMQRKKMEQILNAFAKNMFFSTYRMHAQAKLKLAVTDYTLDLDKLLGKSIKISLPSSAKGVVNNGKELNTFYGRLQDIIYSYQAAKSVNSVSSLSLHCDVFGLTLEQSQGSILFKQGNNILYVNKD